MLEMDDRKLRMMGLVSMIAGLFFLYARAMVVPLASTAPTVGALGDAVAGHHRNVRRVGLSASMAALLLLQGAMAICKRSASPKSAYCWCPKH